jgi:hypothetical protein
MMNWENVERNGIGFFQVQSWNLPGGTEEKHEEFQLG